VVNLETIVFSLLLFLTRTNIRIMAGLDCEEDLIDFQPYVQDFYYIMQELVNRIALRFLDASCLLLCFHIYDWSRKKRKTTLKFI
jgi:hypothetical protein